MLLVLYVAAAINVLVACGVSVYRREHLTLALLFLASLATDLLSRAVHYGYVGHAAPYDGAARALFHVSQACVITWPVGLCAAAVTIFFQVSATPVFVGARLLLWALVLGYPFPFRGHALGLVYAGVSGCAFVVGAAGAVVSLLGKGRPTVTESVLVGAICAEGLTLAGPHLGNVFEEWRLAQLGYGVFYIAAILIQLEALWGSWNRSGTGSAN